jgi:phosphohistidine swiveling domain-containing protein
MSIYFFKDITKEQSFLGGKGYVLGLLKNAGFPVPDGLILTEIPKNDVEWEVIFNWWNQLGSPKIAVRSSAVGEDSSEQSFAGQNSTFLNINSKEEIKTATINCFNSFLKKSSTLYREHFQGSRESQASMNVVLQEMVNPKFSGVYFSVDPRSNQKGWIVEAIEGLGEDLVSGRKTPCHFEENKIPETKLFNLLEVAETGKKVKEFMGLEIDMEWSIDQDQLLKVLQARPVTALQGKSEEKRMIEDELKRLKEKHSLDTIWDGATFAEWNSPPSELTFSIWQMAFAKDHAFSKALKKLGYLGINDELNNETHSLLEKIFDRGYINISMMAPLYFGPIPYKLVFNKSPKLVFDLKKMNFKTILLTPKTMLRMLKVSFRLSTERKKWLSECQRELNLFKEKNFRINDHRAYSKLSDEELLNAFKTETSNFYDQHLIWPLVLITLIESTTQSLTALLKGVVNDNQVTILINKWLGLGIHTVTMDMNQQYANACQDSNMVTDSNDKKMFLQKYGHRAPGELELSNPRWSELGDKTFLKLDLPKSNRNLESDKIVLDEINNLNTYKKQVIEKEWLLLKEMLELREMWKMALLFPYAEIRYTALEIAKRNNISKENIFWFNINEIFIKNFDLKKALSRKQHSELSKSLYLPTIVELKKLEQILNNSESVDIKNILGESLSPGLVYGEVRVVIDPDTVDTSSWPANTILVAESTDPGWTGLFLKSKAIIVEKGGVLSHCAIVAREMNLPAISGIKQCHLRFKDGDKIWVDGNNGRITLA